MGKRHQLERKLTETADNKFSMRDGSISTSKQCVSAGTNPLIPTLALPYSGKGSAFTMVRGRGVAYHGDRLKWEDEGMDRGYG